jgi:hypothetical protein
MLLAMMNFAALRATMSGATTATSFYMSTISSLLFVSCANKPSPSVTKSRF